ncbi:hypothetical protein [Rhodanobacter sp. DHG33]|uniref:hypothetical protein n=1 Tax=Rhodanobacter sp. DHG33 TaxID=2775921 RepID=UPI0017834B9B|nr:hypothetical protein [Rhodanobacter sp. DHG33]MBD8897747.1 hypothetical protein [Rhodanobacter sp. DHG33]
MNPVQRRYMREFWPPMLAYILIMLLVWPLVDHMQSVWGRTALALLPILPVLMVTRAMVRLVTGSDELEQRMNLIGLAIAGTVVGTLCLAGGFLVAAKVVRLDGTALIWVWPAMVVLHTLGRGWAARRYGGDWAMACSNDGLARHWQLAICAAAFGLILLLGWGVLSDWQRGLLSGLTASLTMAALLSAIFRRRRLEDEA